MSMVILKARQQPNRLVIAVRQKDGKNKQGTSPTEDVPSSEVTEFTFSLPPEGVDAKTHTANCRREVKLLMQERENRKKDDTGTALSIEGENL